MSLASAARRDPWTPGLVALLVATFATLLYLGRGTTFLFDDWIFWVTGDELAPGTLLDPYNGQPSLVPKLVWGLTTAIFGGSDYLPFRVGVYVVHLALLAGTFTLLRPRVGGAIALAATVPLAVMGSASLTLLMVNTHHYFVIPLACLVWALVAVERDRDVVACVLLVVSAFTSSSGVVPVAVVLAYLVWDRPQWRRLWVCAVPTALFLLWFVIERPEQSGRTTVSDLALVPDYVTGGFADGIARYTALGADVATPIGIGLLLALVALAASGRRIDRVLAALVFGGATFWALIALGRGPEITVATGQYLFANGFYAGLAAVLAVAGFAAVRAPRTIVVAFVLAAAFAVGNLQELVDAARAERAGSENALAALSALNVLNTVGNDRVAAFNPLLEARKDNGYLPQRYAEGLRQGRDAIGATPRELPSRPDAFRRKADRYLAQGLGAPSPAASTRGSGSPPAVRGSEGAVSTRGACHQVAPQAGPTASLTVAADAPVLVVGEGGEDADVRVRRFADGFSPGDPPLARVDGDGSVIDLPKVDGGGWELQVAAAGPFRVCGA